MRNLHLNPDPRRFGKYPPPPAPRWLRYSALAAATALLLGACGGSSGGKFSVGAKAAACAEQDAPPAYACQTGSTEPLYFYQWALHAVDSFFAAYPAVFGPPPDLNVEPLHSEGLKGQGINALVLDDGMDVNHEDLQANVDRTQTYNFLNQSNDPTPTERTDAHGTHVSGIIAAAQNGLGVMGIAPRATLGGANIFAADSPNSPVNWQTVNTQSYGGAAWSQRADVFNGSFGINPEAPLPFDTAQSTAASLQLRAMVHLRGEKGALLIKSAGNEFLNYHARNCPSGVSGQISCDNPGNDPDMLEPTVIATGAINAKGVKASYSSAGPVMWVAGMGGEFGEGGTYGEGSAGDDGPTIFSTDLSGCARGYSRSDLNAQNEAATPFLRGTTSRNGVMENANCNYGALNGTSAGAPTITGVVALMLAANPALTWRDVRDILRLSARPIDPNFGSRGARAYLLDLRNGSFSNTATGSASDLQDGSPLARVDYGWQTNAANVKHSGWYGFGVPDAAAAVQLARNRTQYLPAALNLPNFSPAVSVSQLNYGQVQQLGSFTVGGADTVDALQVRLSGSFCVGSVGLLVKSPSGTVSLLSTPFNIYYRSGTASANAYGMSSYTFYGEPAQGVWTVWGLNAQPGVGGGAQGCSATPSAANPLTIEYRILAAAS